jgi:hypothetical protein
MEIFIDEYQISCAKLLYIIFKENNGNIDDLIFISTLKKLKADIIILSILDCFIHDNSEDIIDYYDDIFFKLKSDYKNVKINDIIDRKKVVAIFTFTIWLIKN